MKVPLDRVCNLDDNMGRVVLRALTQTADDFSKVDEQRKRGYLDVVMTIDGSEVDLEKFVAEWDATIRRYHNEALSKLLDERVSSVTEMLHELKERVQRKLDEMPSYG